MQKTLVFQRSDALNKYVRASRKRTEVPSQAEPVCVPGSGGDLLVDLRVPTLTVETNEVLDQD